MKILKPLYHKVDFLSRENINTHAEIYGFLSMDEYYSLLARSDYVLMMMPEKADTTSWIPGRTYDYIGMRKSIICLANKKSEIALLMDSYKKSVILYYNETDEIHERKIIKYINNNEKVIENEQIVKEYNRDYQVTRLDKFFETL